MLRAYYISITLISIAIVLTAYFGGWLMLLIGRETGTWFGNAALNLLWIILFAKPLVIIACKFSELKIFKLDELRKYVLSWKSFSFQKLKHIFFTMIWIVSCVIMKYRRLLGITVFILAFTHSGIHIATWLKTGFGIASQWEKFRILSGYLSLFFLFLGYITSNDFALKILKNKRIWIQKSAYLALFFVVLHLVFLDFTKYILHIIMLIFYIYLKLVEKNKCKFFLHPSQ